MKGLRLRRDKSRRSPTPKTSLAGGLLVLASLLFYQLTLYIYPVMSRSIQLLQELAYVVLSLLLVGIFMLLGGMTRYFTRAATGNGVSDSPSTVMVLSLALRERRSFRMFVLASILYAVFFAFVSGFLVYQPLGQFSQSYGVSVPSILPVVCCGALGQMPQFVVYLTQQFAILVVPLNLILLVAVSWLVGLNVAIATYSYRNWSTRARGKWFGGLGAIVGIFTACPTCAGFFFLTMLGLAGGVAFALTLSSLQAIFLGLGLPMLLITPITTCRRIQNSWTASCRVLCDKESAHHRNS
jgi:hypothetical protein